uniref:Acetylcholinesterase n=1 Tax=Strongyloides venezuelensis TaxID=75913 RepID=A0A0K0F518_STRVS
MTATTHGCVIGHQLANLSNVVEYLGIPYAQPPIQKLRFMPPKPLNSTYYGKNCFNATKPARACLTEIHRIGFIGVDEWQPNKDDMSEDCLQLNIWVPNNNTGAVIVFFFGGSYLMGSPSLPEYNGSALAHLTGSIVVNINYRLGVLGFGRLRRGKIAPGNMGLLDQQMALKWVHDNIRNFGGKKNMITLLGHGTGSSSATAHMFSNVSKSYFSRVIAISGTVLNEWALEDAGIVEMNFLRLMKELNCTNRNHDKEVRCMQTKNASEIINKTETIFNPLQSVFRYPFMAVDYDGYFFEGPVEKILSTERFKKDVDILLGKTTNESTIYMHRYLRNASYGCYFYPNKSVEDKDNQCNMNEGQYNSSVDFLVKNLNLNASAPNRIKNLYKSWPISHRDKAIKMFADFLFDCDYLEFGKKIDPYISQRKDKYFFVLGKRISINPWPLFFNVTSDYQSHYMFGHPFLNATAYGDNVTMEQEFSYQYMKILSNFTYNAKLYKGYPDYSWNYWPKFNATKTMGVFVNKTLINFDQYDITNISTETCTRVRNIKRRFRIPRYSIRIPNANIPDINIPEFCSILFYQ